MNEKMNDFLRSFSLPFLSPICVASNRKETWSTERKREGHANFKKSSSCIILEELQIPMDDKMCLSSSADLSPMSRQVGSCAPHEVRGGNSVRMAPDCSGWLSVSNPLIWM